MFQSLVLIVTVCSAGKRCHMIFRSLPPIETEPVYSLLQAHFLKILFDLLLIRKHRIHSGWLDFFFFQNENKVKTSLTFLLRSFWLVCSDITINKKIEIWYLVYEKGSSFVRKIYLPYYYLTIRKLGSISRDDPPTCFRRKRAVPL